MNNIENLFYTDNFFNIEYINQFFFFIKEAMEQNNWWKTPFYSAIFSGVILWYINYLNRENQKLQALYQKKYEFWLEFGKSFFIMQNAILFLLKKENLHFGVVYSVSSEELSNNLSKLVSQWRKFFEMVDGNQKIYLEPENINVLLLQSFVSALREMLENNELEMNERDELTTLTATSMNNLVTKAKLLFENNLKRLGGSQLENSYLNALEYYIEKSKKSSNVEIDKTLSYERKLEIINQISNNAYLDIVSSNFSDISEKILNIVNPAKMDIFNKTSIIKTHKWFWGNIIQKIFSVKNEDSHKVITILWIKIKINRGHIK